MANKEPTSSHLDSMMHVYSTGPLLGTTARLSANTWDKNTVADGYWQTVNTIQPLINRDIYLADAIDKLATTYTKYNAGWGISIYPNSNLENSYFISADIEAIKTQSIQYNFDSRYFTTTPIDETRVNVGLKIDDKYISAGNNGIFCNFDDLLYETRNTTSYSSITADVTTAYTYDYSTASLNITAVTSLPVNINQNTIYLVG